MKKLKGSIFYIVIIGGFSALMYWIILLGAKLEQNRSIVSSQSENSSWTEFVNSFVQNLTHPLALLLAQIVTIILVARFFGWICTKIKMPAVVGEMFAGIVLGPSLLGLYFPEFSAVLFPAKSLGNLQFLSQIGLILFMFIVGMELDLRVLRTKARDAVVVSHASIIFPFALGVGLSYFMYEQFAPANVEFASFALFVGISMSITAFPVLARIVQERGIQKTKLGTIVITCAAADDITAWCILAAVIAIVKAGSFASALYTIVLALLYVLFMINVVRPFLKRVGELHTSRENLSKPIVGIFFLTLILSAYVTEVIGIHALFGAFMAGAIMPENAKFRNIFIEKIEDVALVLLLPLFFVFTGLRTQIGLLNDPYLWKVAGVIVLVAVSGKFIGSAVAARFVGQSWKDSLSIGALMNTRGLMELVVLNIGYDLGVLNAEIFAMMVIMALLTTFMTGPVLDLINWSFKSPDQSTSATITQSGKYNILISFGNPERGRSLLRLANAFVRKLNGNASVTVLHLSPGNELHSFNVAEYEKESFTPVIQESVRLDQNIKTIFKESGDINSDIADIANEGGYDLLLVGIGQSIFEGSLLGKILGFTSHIINPDRIIHQVTRKGGSYENSPLDEQTRVILSKSDISVGVFIDKDFSKTDQVVIPVFDESDSFLIRFAQKLINNSGSQITILDMTGHIKNNPEMKESIRAIEQVAPNHIRLSSEREIGTTKISGYDLMLISVESWKKVVETRNSWLPGIPSALILADRS